MPGVAAVAPQVQIPFEDGRVSGFGIPKIIAGRRGWRRQGLDTSAIHVAQGRLLTAATRDHGRGPGLGHARELARQSATTIDVRGARSRSSAILPADPDLPRHDGDGSARRGPGAVHRDAAAEARRRPSTPSELASQIVVYPADGTDEVALAARIEALPANVTTMTGADFDQQVGSHDVIFNAIIIGVAVISLVVGGLSVINTMAMSVTERTREIGIKRAIGGSRRRIVRELVAEAGLIGLIGGLIGLALGAVVVFLANEAGRAPEPSSST